MLYNIKNIISKKTKSGLIFPYLDVRPPRPLFLLIHITLSCNKKCSWCYENYDEFYKSFTIHMSIDMFKKILCNFGYFKPHIHLYGGEPLFHPEFSLFLKYCKAYGYRPTLTTNGDYLNRYSDIIIQSSLSQLNISLNGLIDSQGNFNSEFQQIIKDFMKANKGRKIINFNYVIEPETHKYIEEIILFLNNSLKEKTFSYFVLQHLNLHLEDNIPSDDFNFIELANLLNRIKKMKLKFKLLFLPNIKIDDLAVYYKTEYTFKNKCYVPWLGLSIYPDLTVTGGGGIFACNEILGNLKRVSIMDIWKGAKLKNFCSRLIKEGLPEICNRCCHKIYY